MAVFVIVLDKGSAVTVERREGSTLKEGYQRVVGAYTYGYDRGAYVESQKFQAAALIRESKILTDTQKDALVRKVFTEFRVGDTFDYQGKPPEQKPRKPTVTLGEDGTKPKDLFPVFVDPS